MGDKPDLVIRLDARKTMDGNIIIQDHPYMDIILSPKNKKIMALSKVLMDDRSYYTQNRFFDYLYKRGVIDPASVQGSNIFASLERVGDHIINISEALAGKMH